MYISLAGGYRWLQGRPAPQPYPYKRSLIAITDVNCTEIALKHQKTLEILEEQLINDP